jgi:hypothetical protein
MNMKGMPKHTRSYLLCFIFVFLCLILDPCVASQSSITENPLSNVDEFHQNFIHHDHQSEPSLIQPQLSNAEIFFPRASRQIGNFPPDLMPHSPTAKETVIMNNSHSAQQIQDMYALNANMQKDIACDDFQSGDPMKKGLKNSMDISISGNRQRSPKDNAWMDGGTNDADIENMVDKATVSKEHDNPVHHQSHTGSQEQQRLGNHMNIDVSGVDVRAMNTVQGGCAVTTSNIIITPVQIINCPPEVEEKLK